MKNIGKKLLVLAADYPKDDKIALMYIHTRNLYYKKDGIDLEVLNFSTDEDYTYEGIKVICLKSYIDNANLYNIAVSHASNIRNHYRFLKKYENNFEKIIFFYHGHEVLKINKVYSKPYSYAKKSFVKKQMQNLYDDYKLFAWRKYLPKLLNKSHLIFVSKWMKDEFDKSVKLTCLEDKDFSIVYNCVDEYFEKNSWDKESKKEYDFITIRSYLDGSKYSVDQIIKLAEKYPQYKFCIIGRGQIFEHFGKPENITHIDKFLTHKKMIAYLNSSKVALMPTRTDAQGLMACEMATFGMPLITSKIPVCYEIFSEFENVGYIKDENDVNFVKLYEKLTKLHSKNKNEKYFYKNTVEKEIELIKKLIGKNNE